MSVQIDSKRCIGCGSCVDVCPGNLLELSGGRAVMLYPRDCWGCASCVKECPSGAIGLFLGADIGGNGSVMKAQNQGNIIRWQIAKPDGSVTLIDINRSDSNRY